MIHIRIQLGSSPILGSDTENFGVSEFVKLLNLEPCCEERNVMF